MSNTSYLETITTTFKRLHFWKSVKCEFMMTLFYVLFGCGATSSLIPFHDVKQGDVTAASLTTSAMSAALAPQPSRYHSDALYASHQRHFRPVSRHCPVLRYVMKTPCISCLLCPVTLTFLLLMVLVVMVMMLMVVVMLVVALEAVVFKT